MKLIRITKCGECPYRSDIPDMDGDAVMGYGYFCGHPDMAKDLEYYSDIDPDCPLEDEEEK